MSSTITFEDGSLPHIDIGLEQRYLDEAEETVQSWAGLMQDPAYRARLGDTTIDDVLPMLNLALATLRVSTTALSVNHRLHLTAVGSFNDSIIAGARSEAAQAALCVVGCLQTSIDTCDLAEEDALTVMEKLVALTGSTDGSYPTLDENTASRVEGAKTVAHGYLAVANSCRDKEKSDTAAITEKISALRQTARSSTSLYE